MTVVADAGPIISFARAGLEDILRRVLPAITIPEAVYDDIALKGAGKPGASLVLESAWIKRTTVSDRFQVDRLPGNLGAGEREAIVLAKQLDMPLLVDDRAARIEAEDQGIVCFGSLRVLKEAKQRAILREVKPTVDALRRSGLRISDTLYQAFLRGVEE